MTEHNRPLLAVLVIALAFAFIVAAMLFFDRFALENSWNRYVVVAGGLSLLATGSIAGIKAIVSR